MILARSSPVLEALDQVLLALPRDVIPPTANRPRIRWVRKGSGLRRMGGRLATPSARLGFGGHTC